MVVLIALIMGAASTFETLVNFYQTTRRYKPEASQPSSVSMSFGEMLLRVCAVMPRRLRLFEI
jgi:hypothetical protein